MKDCASVLPVVAPTCSTTVTPNRSIFKMKVKASTAILKCCSTLEGLRMHPLKKVSRRQQQTDLKMAEQILRSLLQAGVWEIHRNRAITVWHRDIPRGGRCILGSHTSIS